MTGYPGGFETLEEYALNIAGGITKEDIEKNGPEAVERRLSIMLRKYVSADDAVLAAGMVVDFAVERLEPASANQSTERYNRTMAGQLADVDEEEDDAYEGEDASDGGGGNEGDGAEADSAYIEFLRRPTDDSWAGHARRHADAWGMSTASYLVQAVLGLLLIGGIIAAIGYGVVKLLGIA